MVFHIGFICFIIVYEIYLFLVEISQWNLVIYIWYIYLKKYIRVWLHKYLKNLNKSYDLTYKKK